MASQPAFERRDWTYDDYLQLDDDARYEVIEGVLELVPAPDLPHQDIILHLGSLLHDYVRKKGIGRVYVAPADVILDNHNVVQPDILFVASGRSHILQRRGITGSPDLAVEVISPSSSDRDRRRKCDLYERFGVREYWMIDPGERSAEVLLLENGSYRRVLRVAHQGIIRSEVVEGFETEMSDIFGSMMEEHKG